MPIRRGDRGPALFFHGRDAELAAFRETLEDARQTNGGTIFLVQGAPGAGKTALLHECKKMAKEAEVAWRVAQISAIGLYDPRVLAKELDVDYVARITEQKGTKKSIGASVGVSGSLEFTEGQHFEHTGPTVQELLQVAATPHGLLVVLDEAQNLRPGIQTTMAMKGAISACLDKIHNGVLGVPVVLLAGGLGTTKRVLNSFGISRFVGDRIQQLGRLDDGAARKVLRDWLVRSGGAPKGHEHLELWVDTLAANCYGWPQHIQRFAQVAAQWLLDNGGILGALVPDEVLSLGLQKRKEYYHERAEGFNEQDRMALAYLLQENDTGTTYSEKDLVSVLSEDRTREEAKEKVGELLHKGIVAETPRGRYEIPVPSMHDWLVREYANTPRELPSATSGEHTQDLEPPPTRSVRDQEGYNR